MPSAKELTLQDFASERSRAKRTLVRKKDNLAGASMKLSDSALTWLSLTRDHERGQTERVPSKPEGASEKLLWI